MTIEEAIAKSVSTGQIVRVDYDGTQSELIEEIGHPHVDYCDANEGLDVWATPTADSEEMEWRLLVSLSHS